MFTEYSLPNLNLDALATGKNQKKGALQHPCQWYVRLDSVIP